MTNYLGLTEDDGTTQDAVAVRPKVAPVKRPTPTLSVAPQLPIATAQEAAPIDRIVTITPRFYSEARAIGEYYRDGNPVIMNLSDMEDNEADRLDTAWDLTTSSRLGCQAVIKGDVVAEFPMYTRNYVQEGGGIQLGKSDRRRVEEVAP